MRFQPVLPRIIVKVDKIEEKKIGSIIVETGTDPARKQMATTSGTILSISPRCFDVDLNEGELKVGDRIRFVRFAGKELPDEGDDIFNPTLRVINVEDVFAKEVE